MLIHVGQERTERINLALAGILATIAGALNAAGFLAAGVFTANMTGNVSAFADYLVTGRYALALWLVPLVVAFVSGAYSAAALIYHELARRVHGAFAWAIVVEACLLIVLSAGLAVASGGVSAALMTITLSFVMGFQNAVTTLISEARVRTTHVSGMATDIGIGLASLSSDSEGRSEAAARLKLHTLTLSAFAVGGILGAIVFNWVGNWFFAIAAGALLLIGLPEIGRARRLGRG
ncbi:MAG: YoaK family protein [Heliomarina sp.]|uniref:YoaK family protein n=1 Tax=Heliomarina sp. TaxID=2917556 RepID=UPI0040582984